MAQAKGMALRHGIPGIKGAEGLVLIPMLLPFGLDEMKRILSASGCHKPQTIAEMGMGDNGRLRDLPLQPDEKVA
jgi:hypothetical protein